ncbi:hypothetical protein N2152v2_003812 [Parachlorella kessleri]
MQSGFCLNPTSNGPHNQGAQAFRHRPSLPRGSSWGKGSFLALAHGGSGGIGGGSYSGGGGSGGWSEGGSGGAGDEGRKGGFLRRGWEQRAAADPQFGFKVFCELVIGLTAMVLGDMSSRPNWGLNELDFVFATLVVGSIINFSAVWLLAPTGGAGAGTGFLQTLLSDKFLLAWGAPGGHMFEKGYPLGKRLVNLGYKGFVFALIGMGAGTIGTAVSNGLIALRKKLDPNWSTPNVPPNVLANAGAWAAHMGISANSRYQIINGLDMVLQPLMPSSLFRVYSFLLRSANNVLGGVSFVMAARILGVQKAAEAPAQDTAGAKPAVKTA